MTDPKIPFQPKTVNNIYSRRSVVSTVEHHILVLLVGAAIGGFATYTVMNHVASEQKAAVHDALKAAATPAPVPSPKA